MQKNERPTMSLAFLLAITMPMLLVNLIVPLIGEPQHTALEHFLDAYLVDDIGFWSSKLPLSSKITTNYIALTGPIAGAILLFRNCKRIDTIKKDLQRNSAIKIMATAFAFLLLCLFFAHQAYFNSVDLAIRNEKLRIAGQNFLLYTLFSSSILLYIALTPVCIFLLMVCFYYRIIEPLAKKVM
ncbi:hypothetical protein [Pseudomonas sp. B11(2017)]|uniref:hypothetical protein n=1 Tax=Pseudomonas sp. B11(2017) TaxID=1981748 RepID=UPI00111C232D|nr:hypothetical protein [Pseudomonas sp. B11(2017)]